MDIADLDGDVAELVSLRLSEMNSDPTSTALWLCEADADLCEIFLSIVAKRADLPKPVSLAFVSRSDEIDISNLASDAPVLDDNLMTALALVPDRAVRVALAGRADLSLSAARALLRCRDPEIVQSVLANAKISLPLELQIWTLNEAILFDGLRDALSERRDLDVVVAKHLVWWLSREKRYHFAWRYKLGAVGLEEALKPAFAVADSGYLRERSAVAGPNWSWLSTIDQGLPRARILQASRSGDLPYFFWLLSLAWGTTTRLASDIARESDAFMIACRSYGFSARECNEMWKRILFELRLPDDARSEGALSDPGDDVKLYEALSEAEAHEIVVLWSCEALGLDVATRYLKEKWAALAG